MEKSLKRGANHIISMHHPGKWLGNPRTSIYLALFVVTAHAFTLLLLFGSAAAQPPQWNMRVYFLPDGPPTGETAPVWLSSYSDRFFPGEVGNLTFQIINTDCETRAQTPQVREFPQTWEDDLMPVFARLDEVKETGFITDYAVEDSNVVVYGDMKLADWKITVVGHCIGRQIGVVSAKVWFAWPKYGEALNSRVEINRSLRAFDPLKYIFEGGDRESTLVFTAPFRFPPELPSEFFEQQPAITLALRYPSGFTYEYHYSLSVSEDPWRVLGLRGAKYGLFRLSPYRTFSLRVTDQEVGLPLIRAQLIFDAHIYPFSTSSSTNLDGIATIKRLPDFYSYNVKVLYEVPFIRKNITVYLASHEAEELARIGSIRTELYTLRVFPVDLNGRPLVNASVVLHLLEEPQTGASVSTTNTSIGGYAAFYLLPTGNYSFEVWWRSSKVYTAFRYIGYHPTFGFSPLRVVAQASVSDLLVSVTDMGGSPVGAVFDVEGPTAESSFKGLSRLDGVLLLRQMPLAKYLVTATNQSHVFDSVVSVSTTATPGEPAHIRLPIYSVKLRLLSMDGKPIPDLTVVFHRVESKSDRQGILNIAGVPSGAYSLTARLNGVLVYSDVVQVNDNVLMDVYAAVYDVNISLTSWEGEPIVAEWVLEGPRGNLTGLGNRIVAELLPDSEHRVVIYFWERGSPKLLFDSGISPSEVRSDTLRLPVSVARFKVFWSGGEPFSGVLLVDGERYIISDGLARSDLLVHRALNVSVLGFGEIELLRQEVQHDGEEIGLVIQQTALTVVLTDVFTRPVENAKVTLHSARVPGLVAASGVTGPDGSVSFSKLPAVLAPFRVETGYGDEKFEAWASAGVLRFRLNSLVVAGAAIPASVILSAIVAVVAIALTIVLIRRIRARLRREGSEQ